MEVINKTFTTAFIKRGFHFLMPLFFFLCLLTSAKKQMVAIQCHNPCHRPFHMSLFFIDRTPLHDSAEMAGWMGTCGERVATATHRESRALGELSPHPGEDSNPSLPTAEGNILHSLLQMTYLGKESFQRVTVVLFKYLLSFPHQINSTR